MAIVSSPEDFNVGNLFLDVSDEVGGQLFLKCEFFNFAGSVKLKAARSLVDDAERAGLLRPGMSIVESSSGNLGIALSMICASRGYHFTCVTDSRCNTSTVQTMRAYGATVEIVTEPHPTKGLLGARMARVAELTRGGECAVWLNQYLNPENPGAHVRTTGPEILREFPTVNNVFIGVGTAGTVMGTAAYLREKSPETRIIGVDSEGSVTFGAPAQTRHIPGLGAGVMPPQFSMDALDAHLNIPEEFTVHMCRSMARRGFLLGGSSGTVLEGARRWFQEHPESRTSINVALAPDNGDRYVDSVFSQEWVQERYPLESFAASR